MGGTSSCPVCDKNETVDGDKVVKNVSGTRLFDLNMDDFHAGNLIIFLFAVLALLFIPFFWKAWRRWRRRNRRRRRWSSEGSENGEFTVTSLRGRRRAYTEPPLAMDYSHTARVEEVNESDFRIGSPIMYREKM